MLVTMIRIWLAWLTVCGLIVTTLIAPIAVQPAFAAPQDVQVGSASHPLAGTNIYRSTNTMVLYTRTPTQSTSPANQWGVEVAIVNGRVTERRAYQPGMPIPTNGTVLSGHDTAATWLLNNAPVGATITLPGQPPPTDPPPTDPPPTNPPPACSAGHVRLTYDDGPHPEHTPAILDALAARDAVATFFVVGRSVANHPTITSRTAAEGHRVGNHTWDHPYLTQLDAASIDWQLRNTSDLIEQVTGTRPVEWRPPFEDHNATVRSIATSQGLTMVLWNYATDTNDWQGRTAEQIRDTVLNNAKDGSIVLMHDRLATTAAATPMIVDGLVARGFCLR